MVTIIALAAAPFLFKDKIKEMIAKTLNENVNANIAFEDVDLSLFKSFPQAHVTIDKLSIINKAPFAGDTLLYAGETNVTMSVKELFKGEGETMSLESFSAVDGIVNIIFNKEGLGNFDIALKEAEEKKPSDSKPFSLDIQKYGVENLKFTYLDEGSNMKMVLDSIYHEGKGNFAAQKLDLETKTTAKLSFEMEKMNYMNNVGITLDAILGIDLEKSKYEFKDNKALINQLPLEFNGFIQMMEAGQTYDLTFKTPTATDEYVLNTFVEVDLTNQTVIYYKNGEVITQGNVVTGNVSQGHATPAGVYKLDWKAKDYVLRGQGYASPVNFWMPFNGGIGLHDASWRSQFGGSIYKTNGSHGCVNMTYSVAKAIYDNIEEHTTIICKY